MFFFYYPLYQLNNLRNDFERTVEQKDTSEKSSANHLQELLEQLERTKNELDSMRDAYDKLYTEHSETEQRLQDEMLKVSVPQK